jgi:hypothetical protein
MKIITYKFKARMMHGEVQVLADEPIEEVSSESVEVTEDIGGTIKKTALRVADYNNKAQSLARRIHKFTVSDFTILQQRIGE